jgi:hypothetical protein
MLHWGSHSVRREDNLFKFHDDDPVRGEIRGKGAQG